MTSIPQFVFPGQIIESVVLASGGFQFVLSGGQTVGTVINAGGIQLAGGTEDNTTIAGGEQFVFSSSDFLLFSGLGSSPTSAQISALEANVTSLGTLGGLIAGFGGISGFINAVESGFTLDFAGVARHTTVYGGGIQAVGGGAIATNTTVSDGGFQAVLGGVAASTTVGVGGLQFVGAGQELPLFGSGNGNGEVDGSIVNGGAQFVLSGGIARGTVLAGDGRIVVANFNGLAISQRDGEEIVFSGGITTGTVISSGGLLEVASGGTAVGTIVKSGGTAQFLGGAVVVDTTFQNGVTLDVRSGSIVTDFIIDGGTVLEIGSAGTAAGTTTIEDGTFILDSGAVAGEVAFGPKGTLVVSGTSVPAGLLLDQIFLGDRIDLLSVPFVSSGTVSATGGTALDVGSVELHFDTDLTGKTFLLSSDGVGGTLVTLSATSVGSGQTVTVSPGQPSVEIIVLSGGTLNVLSGGTADDVTLSGGTLNVASGGTATNVSISGGTEFVSGVDLGGTVNDGGTQVLVSGGVAGNTLLTDPGVQSVGAGTTATSVTIAGGEQDVLSGGTAISTIVESGAGLPGLQVVESGGIAGATTISAGGVQIVEGGGDAEQTTVSAGGTLELLGGATANGYAIASGGILEIASGFTSTGFAVLSGITLEVGNGGTASNTVVSAGGELAVLSGGLADPTTISVGGLEVVSAGGTDLGALISGGEQDVFGHADGATVFTARRWWNPAASRPIRSA